MLGAGPDDPGPARIAADRTIAALVGAGALDPMRDAAAIQRLGALADDLDRVAARSVSIECPHCGGTVAAGPDTIGVARLSRELRAWWDAIRLRREAAVQGVTIADLFSDLDAGLRDVRDLSQPD